MRNLPNIAYFLAMLGFCPLASGSKGNSLFIGTENTRILIDAGGSFASLQRRLAEIEVDPSSIEAILVTHEHSDHIQAVAQFAKKYRTPIFANAETAKGILAHFDKQAGDFKFKIFTTAEAFCYADLKIHPFSVPHDTFDPVGFTIQTKGWKLGVCTDLGVVTKLVQKELQGSHFLYVEANHQPSMVHSCNRPAIYKERVLGKQGHLSNQACRDLVLSLYHPELKSIHLAHLSSECNVPEVALQTVREGLEKIGKEVEISIAYQDKISKSVLF